MALFWAGKLLPLIIFRAETETVPVIALSPFVFCKFFYVLQPKKAIDIHSQTHGQYTDPNVLWASEKADDYELIEYFKWSSHKNWVTYVDPETREFTIITKVSDYVF